MREHEAEHEAPADAAERHNAAPILTYAVDRLPPYDGAFCQSKEITESGMAILTGDATEEYVLQPASGFIEPEDEEEERIVLDAMQGDHGPLMTVEEAKEYLHLRRETDRHR